MNPTNRVRRPLAEISGIQEVYFVGPPADGGAPPLSRAMGGRLFDGAAEAVRYVKHLRQTSRAVTGGSRRVCLYRAQVMRVERVEPPYGP